MKQDPTQASPTSPGPTTPRPRAIMRGKRHFLNLEGEAAARAGLPDTSMPYSAGSLESIGWLEGWTRARAIMENPEPAT